MGLLSFVGSCAATSDSEKNNGAAEKTFQGAVTTAPVTAIAKQPDGRQFKIRQKGSRSHSWHETLDGYSIGFDQASRTWFYTKCDGGKVKLSPLPLGSDLPKDWPKHINKYHCAPDSNMNQTDLSISTRKLT